MLNGCLFFPFWKHHFSWHDHNFLKVIVEQQWQNRHLMYFYISLIHGEKVFGVCSIQLLKLSFPQCGWSGYRYFNPHAGTSSPLASEWDHLFSPLFDFPRHPWFLALNRDFTWCWTECSGCQGFYDVRGSDVHHKNSALLLRLNAWKWWTSSLSSTLKVLPGIRTAASEMLVLAS